MMMKRHNKAALVIFTKYPEPTKVKTRLMPEFSPEEAAALSRAMAEHVVRVHAGSDGYDVVVGYTPGERAAEMRSWLGGGIPLQCQEGGDLGERQLNALRRVFAAGYGKAAIIGGDCPLVTQQDVCKAFDALDDADVVIGPSDDGGYYLIGSTGAHEVVFRGINWGTSSVLKETIERIEEAGLTFRLLANHYDVDSFEDVERLWRSLSSGERTIRADGIMDILKSRFSKRA
jgi:rSAM/selenodomain-associated transferase 1